MKRIGIVVLAVLLGLAGCGGSGSRIQEEGFSVTFGGIQISPGAEAAPVIDALGEPKSYTESPSCAFEGVERTYYYGSFYLSTCPVEGRDYVYSIWFADDGVATEDGIRIGNTQSEVEEFCGVGCFHGGNACTRTLGNSRLTILLSDGLVCSVQYEWIIE